MKKSLFLICLLAILCLMFTGCNDNSAKSSDGSDSDNAAVSDNGNKDKKDVVEIKEKLFIQQCNDIYNNPDDYKNKTIKIEGICDVWQDEQSGKTWYLVYRNTPGCCGADGQLGFQFTCEGDINFKKDDWISVTGTTKVVDNGNGYKQVTLTSSEVLVKTERGTEFVNN